MDIYKLLSRSTKLAQNSRTTQPQRALPSSGQNANPQLFGHDTPAETPGGTVNRDTVLGKRKRKGRIVVHEELPPELDFFRERQGGQKREKAIATNGNDRNGGLGSGKGQVQEEVQEEEDDRLDEDECKSILRSHKVKVTLLSEPLKAETGEKKRKSKDEAKDATPPAKSKPQIYPQPLTSFTQLRSRYGISKRLAENIAHQGYKLPTEVQLAALPLLMGDVPRTEGTEKNVDLLAVAPTGSGKTLAFLIPVLDALFKDKKMDQETEPQAIIVAPTRELANQIVNEGRKLVENTGIRISLVRKGMSIGKRGGLGPGAVASEALQEDEDSESSSEDEERPSLGNATKAKKPGYVVKSHVLVSTPLTLLHAIEDAHSTPVAVPSVRFLVLDEADVLLDPLFREQTLSIWNACSNPAMRTSLWSATMSSSIETLALDHISKNRKNTPHSSLTIRLVVGLKDTALPNINHILTYAATETGKLLALRQLLHPTAPETDSSGRKSLRPPFLVFTQTIDRAKALHAELRYDIPPEAGGSSRIAALHSDMSETARGKVMASFRRGEVWVIITTDLLARGIDFRGLNGVVNYDVPTSAAAYVHRVGRTGRAGREGGVAVTLYTQDDVPHIKPIANVIAASEKLGGESEGKGTVKQWLLDALPTPSKRDKQILKRKGVESRRAGTKTARISTKSKLNRGMMRQSKKTEAPKKVKNFNLDEEFGGFSD